MVEAIELSRSLREVLLFDQNRKPAAWQDLMQAGQYAVFLSDAVTHAGMRADGRYTGRDVLETCLIFDSLDEAVDYCRSSVPQAARLRCEVFDSRGKAEAPAAVFVSPAFAGTLASESKGRRLMWVGLVLIALSLPLFWLDSRADWHLILPTILGLNLLLAGGRFIQLGSATREAARRGGPAKRS
jgi:hypothetical protein